MTRRIVYQIYTIPTHTKCGCTEGWIQALYICCGQHRRGDTKQFESFFLKTASMLGYFIIITCIFVCVTITIDFFLDNLVISNRQNYKRKKKKRKEEKHET
ncbi:hypothetical protein ACJX0J_030414 [Zea mays]